MLLNSDLDNLSSSFIKNLFNEAEGDPAPAPQTADTNAPTDGGDPAPAEQTGDMNNDTEDMANETGQDDYQMNDEDMEDPDMGGMDEGDPSLEGESEEGGDDSFGSDDSAEGEDKEIVKKYFLLKQYNEFYSTVTSLLSNLQEYCNRVDDYKYDDVSYIISQLQKIKNDLIFTITLKFKEFDYQKLITIYAYFEENLNRLTILTEKVIEDNLND